ncbi:DUF3298 domain-containing protein [Phocaeicola sp.]
MTKRNLVLSVMATCLVSCFLLSGCNGQKQIDSETVKTVKVEEQAHLQDDTVSPTCQITIDYSYLAKSDAADSIVQRINRTIQAHILGKEYTRMNPEVAVDSFKNTYINNYRKDVNEFYQEDIKNGTPKDELPTWYNYEYGLTTYFSEGKEGILNFIAETFEYTGGAHPNSWNKWMNFEKNTGKLLALKDVFMAGSEKPISDMLLEELITEMATRLEDSSITSLEGLQNAGILNSTNMYVPDNFLLEKEKVSFLYNKYDIAPYAVGIITLSLPYTSVEKYMIH